MANAASSGHPIDRARSDHEITTLRVLVPDRAVIEICYGRQPNVRVWPDIKSNARCIFHRAEMIKEDEWPYHFSIVKRQNAPNDEAIAKVLGARPDYLSNGGV